MMDNLLYEKYSSIEQLKQEFLDNKQIFKINLTEEN